ncbi:uncharacterized protein LOC144099353 isoform X1 [Amblyomma americanum]
MSFNCFCTSDYLSFAHKHYSSAAVKQRTLVMLFSLFSVRGTPPLHVFANFPYGVAITDIDNDNILDCLTAKRKDFDPEAKTVTYVWSLNGGEGNNRYHVAFHHTAGATPDATNFTVGKDSDNVEVAHFLYSDNKDCAIVDVPHFGDECVLFVSQEKENDVPEICLEHFADICGDAIAVRDRHRCVDDDTDEEDY